MKNVFTFAPSKPFNRTRILNNSNRYGAMKLTEYQTYRRFLGKVKEYYVVAQDSSHRTIYWNVFKDADKAFATAHSIKRKNKFLLVFVDESETAEYRHILAPTIL